MAINLGPGGDTDGDLEEMVEINTTPLIDVMLVLLIMLIITIPLQTQSIDLHLPVAKAERPSVPPAVIVVDLDAAGVVHWNGQLVTDGPALGTLLGEVARQPDQPELHLQANRDTAYKHLAALLAAAQRIGVRKIGIIQMAGP